MSIPDIRQAGFDRVKGTRYTFCTYNFRLEEGGRLMVLNAALGVYESFNQTASLVFLMCNGSNSLAQILAKLRQHFPNAPQALLLQDLLAITTLFTNRGLCGVTPNGHATIEPLVHRKSQAMLDDMWHEGESTNYISPAVLVIDC